MILGYNFGLIGFFSAEWLVLIWIIWYLGYLAGMEVLMVTPLRRMYHTFNMARPAARWINAGITMVLVGSLGWVAWMMIERL